MPRHLVIGDIHGCYDALRALLNLVEPGEDDVLITLGDYVNKGPDTQAVIASIPHLIPLVRSWSAATPLRNQVCPRLTVTPSVKGNLHNGNKRC